MRFFIDDLPVVFPYPTVYPEQYKYMCSLKETLDGEGHAILEMPTGTGKTVSLLSLIVSYIREKMPNFKLIYWTRTVVEMEKVLEELKGLMDARLEEGKDSDDLLALCLSTRRNLWIHKEVKKEVERTTVDRLCRIKTAEWVRNDYEMRGGLPDIEDIGNDHDLCRYYEGYMKSTDDVLLKTGIYTLEDLKEFGEQRNICPYYLVRQYLYRANIIVFNYAYMIDPKISAAVSSELNKDWIVVFDECHNMDNACIEGLTLHIDKKMLQLAVKNIEKLKTLVDESKKKGSRRLQSEYNQLLKSLSESSLNDKKKIRNDVIDFKRAEGKTLESVMPGNIRKADHFLAFVRRVVMFVKEQLTKNELMIIHPSNFMFKLQFEQYCDERGLKFAHDRLNSLLNTLEIIDVEEYSPLKLIVDFGSMLAEYEDGFSIIIDPYPEDDLILDPKLIFYCMDASIAVKPLFAKYRNVILTSGTISPLPTYAKLLDFKPVIMRSFGNTLPRNAIYPLIVNKGTDQLQISSKFDDRDDSAILRNYGALLSELWATVPDGIVCFFPSYRYMENIICKWDDMGIMQKILEHKLIYVETKDLNNSVIALENFRKSCDWGRGAIFLSIARGKVAEGVDFQGHYGRCVVVIGIPFQYTLSRTLKCRLEFLKKKMDMDDSDFLIFDAMRQTAQWMGRVIRNKQDYGLMVFADKRYARKDKISKLPQWIQDKIEKKNTGISTDMGVQIAKSFFKDMSQPFEFPKDLLYDNEILEELNQKRQEEAKPPLVDLEGESDDENIIKISLADLP